MGWKWFHNVRNQTLASCGFLAAAVGTASVAVVNHTTDMQK